MDHKNHTSYLLEYKHCDITVEPTDVIVHQINAVTLYPAGLALTLKKKYPYSDRYGERRMLGRNLAIEEDRDIPGTILVRKPTAQSDPIIIGIVGQYSPGKPRSKYETGEMREKWFQEGLEKIKEWIVAYEKKKKPINKISFPYTIGCGLAGGNWDQYDRMIQEFTKAVGRHVVICDINNLIQSSRD